ncbi:MAG: ATP-binding protein [Desulfobacterales bacterium]|jgi:two-component system sensor histidine kinase HydH
MKFLHLKKLYIPALSIVAIVFLLLVLISISTYRNLDREKTRALHFLHRQGVTLLKSIEASARTGMKSLMWQEVSLGKLLQETAKDEEIGYVYLIDGHGVIAHHSAPSKEGERANWVPDLADSVQIVTRIRDLPDGVRIYEFAKYFQPMYEPSIIHSKNSIKSPGQLEAPHSHRGDIIVLGMKMTAFEDARRADIQHALIMAGIILVLGSGALFFIFVIQNYYLVNRTLKQTQDYTRQVVASMANGLLSINNEGRITSYNPLSRELLGLKDNEIQGMDLKRIFDFKEAGIFQTLDQCVSILDREINYRKISGEEVPLALSITPILAENNVCQGAVIILRDLREIKQLEEKVRRSEKLAAIGELAAGVAHEIRNPLSSIRGFAQYLRHVLKDKPKEKEYAETMVSEVDRINTVVTDLLTFARPLEADLVPTDVTDLVERTVRLVQADARSRYVVIQINISDLSKIPLDANQMTQAILNLLLNALQAVKSGGHIEVGAELDPSVSRLKIWVEDDGVGISRDQKEKLFDPFFTTREKGTGLGLAIVHKIVENHNGEINLQSPPTGKDQGCRFTIGIPIKSHEPPN